MRGVLFMRGDHVLSIRIVLFTSATFYSFMNNLKHYLITRCAKHIFVLHPVQTCPMSYLSSCCAGDSEHDIVLC